MSWKDITDEELGFVIQRTIADSAFVTIDTVDANVTEFTDTPPGPDRKVVYRVFAIAAELRSIPSKPASIELLTGNEAISLGLIKGGLKTYVAYPMTPSSGILHFLANVAEDFSLKVIHPESEIAVILMALGFSYMGEKVAVGTSGGGFCLMNEGFSLAGMAELPLVIVVGQRPGPSTGLPTYTSQADLLFVLM